MLSSTEYTTISAIVSNDRLNRKWRVVPNHYGIGSVHNFKKEIEDTLRPAMERQTRADMHSEPSHQAVDNEIAYRWSQEVTAMEKLTNDELEVAYKQGMKPSEYLAYKE